MVDTRFFTSAGAVSISEIATLTGAVITSRTGANGAGDRSFGNVAPLDRAGANDISFLDNIKYVESFATSNAGACFIRPKFIERAPENMLLLVTDEPYYAYALTSRRFYPEPKTLPEISPTATIAATATIGANTRIDAGAVIGEHAKIGESCWIGANSVISDHVEIGSHSRIGALCTLSHTIIGQRAILHRGIHIGQDGFGFASGKKGIVKVPQLGRVMIGDDVEIGSGTCIDRGAGPDTVIGSFSKIDNLVQIGHNVQMGKYVIIAAQCGIAGSTQIGDGAMFGGQVGISGHVRIGAGAKLAAQAGIMTDIPPGATYGGSPAVPARDWHRQTIAVAKLLKKKEHSDA
jgi:UDP-3-O-[3-hydroxymyristoyl] glucosamine N-acyltransferase